MKNDNYHESVMTREVIENLHIKKACKYIDATEGTGGHTLEIAKQGGEVLGIEVDPEMLAIAKKRLESSCPTPKLILGNFIDIDKIAHKNGYEKVSGIIFDLGVSNLHLTDTSRGFSFGSPEADLDMRLNRETQGVRAMDLMNVLRKDQLVNLFDVTLDPGPSRWLSDRVINFRQNKLINTVSDFLEICKGLKTGKKTLNEATLPFLALRIAVNGELDNLRLVLPKAFSLLEKGGRLIVITFHSGEDSIVKEFFGKNGELIIPKGDEIDRNQRARSAKMRVLKK
jgi:16S rRNA (cytosine1402-N4)-methyltransferase